MADVVPETLWLVTRGCPRVQQAAKDDETAKGIRQHLLVLQPHLKAINYDVTVSVPCRCLS